MAKFIEIDLTEKEKLSVIAKALASTVRLEILELLNEEGLIIGDIARKLQIPASSAAVHVKALEQAGLIRLEEQPGTRGSMKLCSCKTDYVRVNIGSASKNVSNTVSVEMPIGHFSECMPVPTCGMAGEHGNIGIEDSPGQFYVPERMDAKILWSSGGYVEYIFPSQVPAGGAIKSISISLELCSEAPGYNMDWKSDITLWVNGKDCGYFRSPSDFGERRGRLTPEVITAGSSQYGLLTTWMVNHEGSFINGSHNSDITVEDLKVQEEAGIRIRIGNKEDARYSGGFNLYGKGTGDYDQDIVMTIEY